MITLRDLLRSVEIIKLPRENPTIRGLRCFSQAIRPGWAYVACNTPWLKGADGIEEARHNGAAAVVIEEGMLACTRMTADTVVVRDSSRAYSDMCSAFFRHPQRSLRLCGVTGTKGKTTTCYLVASGLRSAGLSVGTITTICRDAPGYHANANSTTPEPFELYWTLARMRALGTTHVVLEASSMGLAEGRLRGLRFDAVAITNLGHDHLTYHGGIENYRAAKAKLIAQLKPVTGKRRPCFVNADDPASAWFLGAAGGEATTFGLQGGDIKPENLDLSPEGVRMDVAGCTVRSGLLGAHNAYNIVCAVALLTELGAPPVAISDGISKVDMVPGRLELVGEESGVKAYVDFAHTEESVSAALEALRASNPGRKLVTVLGCEGGSDPEKRPAMARAALFCSDACVFTSDDPRWEEPGQIVEAMLAAVMGEDDGPYARVQAILDRRTAIQSGVEIARKLGAVLAVLGRGHERFQIVRGARIPFDDREVVAEALRSLRG